MHCFNEGAPLTNIFDCMKGHNRKLNRLRERGSTMAAVLSRCKTGFCANGLEWEGGIRGGWWRLVLTRKAACYIVTVPWFLPLLLSIQLCIIGLVTDGLLLSLIVIPHLSQALTRERERKVQKRDGKRWKEMCN